MRLTEEMVIARSKQSDLNNIRRLNLWGTELTDVSIVKKMASIEVLALSVNNISSLEPFEHCYKLQELYLRRNKVSDFKELLYLQKLPKLKHLWLDENPCSLIPGLNYRAKVLSMLPNLVKLDDREVTQEDLEMAERFQDENPEVDSISPPPSPDLGLVQQEMLYEEPSPTGSARRPQRDLERTPPQTPQSARSQDSSQRRQQNHAQQQNNPQRETTNQNLHNHNGICALENNTEDTKSETIQLGSNLESPSSSQQSQRSPGSDIDNNSHAEYLERAPPMHPSCSTQSMKEYYQSDRPAHPPASYRHSQTDLTDWEEHQHQQQHQQQQHSQQSQQHSQQHNNHYSHPQQQYQSGDVYGSTTTINYAPRNSISGNTSQRNGMICRENGDEWDDGRFGRTRRSEGRFYASSPNTTSNPTLFHGYQRRPASRSANLLSAALCLVKELDYPSLEVIEHAVRCRIDELTSD